MAWKCYKKLSPENSPLLSNGAKCKFDTVDTVWGFFSTENENIHNEFAQMMAQSRYGITEIPPEEFHQFIEKKKALAGRPLPRVWREEIVARAFSSDTVTKAVERPKGDAVAVADRVQPLAVPSVLPVTVPVSGVEETNGTTAQSTVPVITDYKPPTAKRAKMKPPRKG